MQNLFRWSLRLFALASVAAASLAAWQYYRSEYHIIGSSELRQTREYRIFNPSAKGPIIYALDGQSLRNGLSPAIIFSLAALLRASELPKIVAIYSNDDRERDFRRAQSTPTHWRPTIVGRSPQFDSFLLNELIPEIESHSDANIRRYLMGHSLSGLYALDFGTRNPAQLSGIFAFAPTFSHDMSIADRLVTLCQARKMVYVNWGLESARDTGAFKATVARWKRNPICNSAILVASRHNGSPHQTIMLTGQIHTAFLLP